MTKIFRNLSLIRFGGAALCLVTTAALAKQDITPTERNFGIGDVVFSEQLKEALPNAFGGADIFGRKRVKGVIEPATLASAATAWPYFIGGIHPFLPTKTR